jgi:hypothetical protein
VLKTAGHLLCELVKSFFDQISVCLLSRSLVGLIEEVARRIERRSGDLA